MKKLTTILLAAVLVLATFAGCGGSTPAPSSAAPAAPAESAAAPAESAAAEAPADSGDWKPERPVNIVVPMAAGGSTDLLARTIEKVWPKYCEQPVQIVNKPGGGGVTGATYVANSTPDGYTLVMGYGSGHDMSMPFLQKLEYDPFSSLDAVARISVHTVMIGVPADSQFQTLKEVFDWSQESGEVITAAGATANGTVDLVLQALAKKTGANIVVIPHDGGGPSVTALVGGQTVIGGAHPSEFLAQVKAGRIRLVGVATEERDSSMPDVPTLKEQGIDFASWGSIKGIACPKNTPENIRKYYSDILGQICEDEEFKTTMQEIGQPVMYEDYETFTKSFKEASDYYKQMIEDLGLTYQG